MRCCDLSMQLILGENRILKAMLRLALPITSAQPWSFYHCFGGVRKKSPKAIPWGPINNFLLTGNILSKASIPGRSDKISPVFPVLQGGIKIRPCLCHSWPPRISDQICSSRIPSIKDILFYIPAEGFLHLRKGPVHNRNQLEPSCKAFRQTGLH